MNSAHFINRFCFGCMDRLCGRTGSNKSQLSGGAQFLTCSGPYSNPGHAFLKRKQATEKFTMCFSHLIRPSFCSDTVNNTLITHLRDLVNLMKTILSRKVQECSMFYCVTNALHNFPDWSIFLLSCSHYLLFI